MTASPAPVLEVIYDKVIKFYKKFQKISKIFDYPIDNKKKLCYSKRTSQN